MTGSGHCKLNEPNVNESNKCRVFCRQQRGDKTELITCSVFHIRIERKVGAPQIEAANQKVNSGPDVTRPRTLHCR